jgi:hypothetical protein
VLCITTIGNVDADMDRLVEGFTEVADHFGRRDAGTSGGLTADLLAVRPETVLTPREAFFAADQAVPLRQASGRVAAEAITPYPPGIPLVMPGDASTTTSSRCCRRFAMRAIRSAHRIRRWKWCSRSAERDLSSGGWAPSGRPA